MAGHEIYRVEIPIIVDDQSDASLRRAEERVSRFQRTAERRTKVVQDRLNELDRMRVQPHLDLRERITQRVREVSSSLRQLTSRGWNVVVDVKDKATGAIRGIISKARSLIASPLMLLGVGGGVAGATAKGLSMVMEEQDLTSAFQVMLGSREAAEERMQELIKFAGQTPFTRQEIWRSSRQLELLTGGALSTGEGLRLVGDIAAGTVQPFEEVSMWIGRLYDGLESGRPIGQAAMRLQEMGALSGAARARLEQLAESGKDITEIWPLAAKEFGRFSGLMEMQSKNLRNIMLGTKTFFTENVIKRWGQGVADALQPALWRFREWRSENAETVERMGEAIQRFGRDIGGFLVDHVERAVGRISKIMSSPEFEHATFGEKVRMLVSAAMEDVIAWLDSEGKDKMVAALSSMGEAAAKGYIAGMKELGSRTVEELKQGNVKGAAVPAGAMYFMGGAAIARGAWGLGKGALSAGRWLAGRVPLGAAATSAATMTGGVASAGGTAASGGRMLPMLTQAQPWLGRIALPLAVGLEALGVARADDKREAAVRGTGRIAGMVAGGKAGGVAGGAIGGLFGGVGAAPGAVIGSILGGIGGFFGGQALADRVNEWIDKVDFGGLKSRAAETWEDIKSSAADAWEEIRRTVSLETLARGAGFLLGYLESTIFSGEWWLERWENVKAWAVDRWAAMGEVWDNAKSAIMDTIFSGAWWSERWESVKSWTSEKWEGFKAVWDGAKSTIANTLFNKDWWSGQWGAVKGWASSALSNIAERWEGIKASFEAGRERSRTFTRGTVAGMGDLRQAEYTAHARGGILAQPHLGLVAEAGPEAIIPLAGHRSRALDLWAETGRRLGASNRIRTYAAGGFAGVQEALPVVAGGGQVNIPASTPRETETTVNLNFDLAGLVGQVVIENKNDIDGSISKITGEIAERLRKVFLNLAR